MSAAQKRFQVCIKFEAKVHDGQGGEPKPFVELPLTYHDISYESLVSIERGLIDFLGQMNDWGVIEVLSHSDKPRVEEKLQAMGMGGHVAALAAKRE